MAQDFQLPSAHRVRNYEAVLIFHPDSTEAEQKQILKKNSEIIKNFSGEMNHVDTWGRRKLANPIRKITRGVYFHTTFRAEGGAITEMERVMRINDKVLRFCHTKLDDRTSLSKFLEDFKSALTDTISREKDREAKAQAKRAAFAARRSGGKS